MPNKVSNKRNEDYTLLPRSDLPVHNRNAWVIASIIIKVLSILVVAAVVILNDILNALEEDKEVGYYCGSWGVVSLLLDIVAVPLLVHGAGCCCKPSRTSKEHMKWLKVIAWILYATMCLFGAFILIDMDFTDNIALGYLFGATISWILMFFYVEWQDELERMPSQQPFLSNMV